MAFFTGKGDDGTTKTFKKGQSMSKGSLLAEALGTMDEINSFLGYVKSQARAVELGVTHEGGVVQVHELVHHIQKNLFIIQAELAGDESKRIKSSKVSQTEDVIKGIEAELPPITSFLVAGATELGALFDVARTISRRAERRVVEANELARRDGPGVISEHSLAYLNRLSSLLYAFARLANHRLGGLEEAPDYQ